MHQNLPKTATFCLKTINLINFEIPPKIKTLVFFKKNLRIKDSSKHVSTIQIFNTNFCHMPFLLSKNGLCMWIASYPFVQNDIFLKVLYVLWVWDFVDMYLTHPRTRMWRGSFHMYFKKWFFWVPKHYCIPWTQIKKTFSSTLNIMIS
jgi:hypothetical protein